MTPTITKKLPHWIIAACTLLAGAQAVANPFVLAYTDGQDPQSYTNLQSFYTQLSAIGLGSAYGLTASGSIDSSGVTSTTTSIIAYAKGKKLPAYPTVSDYSNDIGGFDPNISNTILKSATNRSNAINNLIKLASANGFAGVDLDFEAVQPSEKANFSAFVSSLASALHGKGMKLIISAPPMTGDGQPSYLAGYDYQALGAAVDYFQLMTYDEVGPGWSSSPSATWPGPDSGLDWMKTMISYAISRVPASKVLEGLPAYGYDFSTGNQVHWKGYSGQQGFADVIAAHKATVYRDATSDTPYANWGKVTQQQDGEAWSASDAQPAMWYDDVASITAKSQLVTQYNLGGTSVWAMAYEDANFWNAVAAGLGTPGTGSGGGTTSNIASLGTGYIWIAGSSATSNASKSANAQINDGNTNVAVTLNPNSEGGNAKWEAAGVIWSAVKTISSAKFVNGSIDSNGNGYFESGVTLEYTTNGTTWLPTGWSIAPAYPNSAAAANQTYTFTGSAISGVLGVRVVGQTGASSWSGSVTEVEVLGY